jgi:hemin uptake protein HemP
MPTERPGPPPTTDAQGHAAPEGTSAPRHDHPTASRRIHSDSILQGAKQVEICHQGEVYRLQLTRLGKLILTK